LQAQVRIGGTTDPAPGAILDLNSTAKGGLLLSNVTLTDLCIIPNEIYDAAAINADATKKAALKGAMVYHTGGNDIPAGVYIWKGWRWISAGGDPILYDEQGNDYTIGYFGEAGWWMTQNLRSTETVQSGSKLVVPPHTGGTGNESFFSYPGKNTSILATHPEYGLLYTWAAANIGVDPTNEDTNPVKRQGICPTGWHLPNTDEWTLLESIISASKDGEYSTTKNLSDVGKKMKSTIPVTSTIPPDGSSFSHKNGGFDVLLVGLVSGGSFSNYGSQTYFWSSSCRDTGGGGMLRNLRSGSADVHQYGEYKQYLFSVRCKKD
jgi:uncharacterized protein (TIGR02145 family)